MNPVIGGFEFAHLEYSLIKSDPIYFVTQGDITLFNDVFDDRFIHALKQITNVNKSSIKVQSSLLENPDEAAMQVNFEFKRSLEYVAPEILLNHISFPIYYESKIDTYSLGCIFYFMLYNKPPFQGNSQEDLIEALKARKVLIYEGTALNSVMVIQKALSLNP